MFNIIYRLYFYPIPRPSPPYIPSPLSLYLIARQGIGKMLFFKGRCFQKDKTANLATATIWTWRETGQAAGGVFLR